jgi:predicted RNA polymerase sigma factor
MKKSIIVLIFILLTGTAVEAKDKITKKDLLQEQLKTTQTIQQLLQTENELLGMKYIVLQQAIKKNDTKLKDLAKKIKDQK